MEICNCIILPITKINREIWEHMRNPSNHYEVCKNTLFEVDKASEFSLTRFKSIADFDKEMIEEEYDQSYSADTIKFFRNVLEECLKHPRFVTEDIDCILIDYVW